MSTAYSRRVNDDREAWRSSMLLECMYCGRAELGSAWLEVHEMERKGQAAGRWGTRCNYLLLCPFCHDKHFANMDHSRQLAVKLINDPEHFDLDEWLLIYDPTLRAPERVTLGDIMEHLQMTEG